MIMRLLKESPFVALIRRTILALILALALPTGPALR